MEVPHPTNVKGFSSVIRELAERGTKNNSLEIPTVESIDKLYESISNLIISAQDNGPKSVVVDLREFTYLLAEKAVYFHLSSFSPNSSGRDRRLDFVNCLKQMEKVFRDKNRDYGNSFRFWGITGLVVRIGDKVFRIKQLSNKHYKRKIRDEKMPDTALDLANYAVMLLILLNENRGIKLGQ